MEEGWTVEHVWGFVYVLTICTGLECATVFEGNYGRCHPGFGFSLNLAFFFFPFFGLFWGLFGR